MTSHRYNIIFEGQTVQGRRVEDVKRNLAILFKVGEERTDRFFGGKPVVVKRDVDYQTAVKYQKAFEKAGAICQAVAIHRETAPLVPLSADRRGIAKSSRSKNMICPQCGFEQKRAEQCIRCGIVIGKQDSKTQVQTAPGPSQRPGEGAQLRQVPENFLGRLFHFDEDAGDEIKKLVIGAAIIGAIAGFLWGGLFDPWRNKGVAAAALNLVLFGGWGLAESMGALFARNLRLVRSRGMLILAGSLCGGAWVSLFTAIDQATDKSAALPPDFGVALAAVFGFIIGGGISAICVAKLSRLLGASEEHIAAGAVVESHEKEELRESSAVVVLAVIGLVFGVIGLLGSLIPLIGGLAFLIGVPAAAISGIALAVAHSRKAKRTFALVALTISMIGVGISGFQFFGVMILSDWADKELEKIDKTLGNIQGQGNQETSPIVRESTQPSLASTRDDALTPGRDGRDIGSHRSVIDVVRNGDFEQGLENWQLSVNNKGKITVQVMDSDEEAGNILFIERLNSGNDGTYSGVTQKLGISLESVEEIVLEADLKPEMQTLVGTGWFGGEYPIGIRIRVDDPSFPKGYRLWFVGLYTKGNNQYQNLYKAPAGKWMHIEEHLTGLFPETATLNYIQVIGSGWDYRGAADNVRLFVKREPAG